MASPVAAVREGKPKVFLSYARADDEPFVGRLQADLIRAGVEVWWDRTAMESRGRTFLQGNPRRDRGCRPCHSGGRASAISSQYVRYEWDHALLFAKGIVPILRLGTYELLPEELPGENAEGLARTDLTKLPRFSSGTPIPRRASPNSSRSYTSQWRLSAPARRERPAVSQSGSR